MNQQDNEEQDKRSSQSLPSSTEDLIYILLCLCLHIRVFRLQPDDPTTENPSISTYFVF